MVALTDMVDYDVSEDIAVLSINNPPVNALSQGVRQGLKARLAMRLAGAG